MVIFTAEHAVGGLPGKQPPHPKSCAIIRALNEELWDSFLG